MNIFGLIIFRYIYGSFFVFYVFINNVTDKGFCPETGRI